MDEEAQTRAALRPSEPVLGLRILAHPDLARVGSLCAPLAGALSRLQPAFADGPLASVHVSRTPVAIEARADGVLLRASSAAKLTVEGQPLVGELALRADALDAGVVLTLGRAVALWLGRFAQGAAPQLPGFVGVSAAAAGLKRRLAQLAPQRSSVLLLGAAGAGKHTAARVLHALSDAIDAPYVEELCALDATALAALEARLARRPAPAGERVIAGCAHEPASPLHALFEERVSLPALRERPEDIAPLFVHFVREALERVGATARFRAFDEQPPFLPAALIAGLVRAPWNGNARQLRAFAEDYVRENHAQGHVEAASWLDALPRNA